MKSLALYLLLVFALTCGMLLLVRSIDPPKPELVIDATPAGAPSLLAEPPPIPITMCIRVLPPPNRRMKGISRA